MAKLQRQEIEKLAHLARLTLTDEEKKAFEQQFAEILTYISKIQSYVKDSYEQFQSKHETVLRQDKVVESEILPEDLLKNAPCLQDGYIKVPGVFEEL